jgi:hypothetical protein
MSLLTQREDGDGGRRGDGPERHGARGAGRARWGLGGAGALGRITYATAYAITYTIVFPLALVARAVPKDNALVHGLIDGAHAAREFVGGKGRGPEASPA